VVGGGDAKSTLPPPKRLGSKPAEPWPNFFFPTSIASLLPVLKAVARDLLEQ
jgi:hypothetical protein